MDEQLEPRLAGAPARPNWLPPLAGWLTFAVGLLNVGSALTPNLAARARLLLHIETADFVPLAHALALAAGVALIVLAVHLGRRRRRAMQLAVVVLLAAGVLNLVKGLDWEEALVSWGVAGVLLGGRHAFYVHQGLSLPRAARIVPALVALAYTAAFVAVAAASGHVTPSFTVGRGLSEAFWRVLLTPGSLSFHHPFGWIPQAIGFISLGTLLAIAYVLFRPLAAPNHRTEDGHHAAIRIVRSHGDDTLSFFKLRADKQYLFDSEHRAFVGYGIQNGVLLVSGDPVGPADALPDLALAVREFAQTRGLKLGVLGASERTLALWEELGLRSFYIGDEAVVDTARFSLEGRPIRKVRQSVTRSVKAGFEAELSKLSELTEERLRELEVVSDRWRAGEPERGFSMAMDSLRGEHLHDSAVIVARDGGGAVRGFLHFVPVYGRPAMSLSFMRRDRDTPNGLTEFMVVKAIELLRERDVAEVSLNFAAFARMMHSPKGRWDRLLGRLASIFNPYFQIESLYKFNAKFFPRWEPRYLLYQGALGFPRAGIAALWAEGQLPKPRLGSPRGETERPRTAA